MSTNIGFRYAHTIGLLAQTGRGFSLPVDCALGPEGVLYVLNRGTPTQRNTHVTICTVGGDYRTDFGSYGAGDGQFIWPTSIVVDREGCVYISSESEHIGLDTDGNVYVADWRNDRVQKFTPEGKFLAAYGTPGDHDGEFHRPSSVTVDRDGNMYVADWGNNRVQVLGSDGRFRVKLLGDAGLSKWAQEFLPANPDYMEARATAKNRETERFLWGPTAVKLDAAGQVYIVDSCRYRIQIYRRSY